MNGTDVRDEAEQFEHALTDRLLGEMRGRLQREITRCTRAASTILVQTVVTLLLLLLSATATRAQTQPPASPTAEPFQITDNSFLMEEAFNQEPRIFQNIVNWSHQDGEWFLSFTQEWPVPGVRHQLSYSIPFNALREGAGIGDSLLNYRLQVLEERPGRPAFAPRLSLIVPTARIDRSSGVQVNLPFSKQRNDFYFHWNAGG